MARAAIAKVLNHAETGVTAIYDRSTGEREVEQALALWGGRMQEILLGGEPEMDASTQPASLNRVTGRGAVVHGRKGVPA